MMLTGANAKRGLHLPPILNRSKADIRASMEDECPTSDRRYNRSNRDERTSRSLNINTTTTTGNNNNKRSMPFNSDTAAANSRQNSSNYRSAEEGLCRYGLTTAIAAVPCALQTTAKCNRQQMSNGIQRHPLPIKPLSKRISNDQLTKRNSCSEVPPLGVNRSPRTIDGRPDGQPTASAHELLHHLIATRKSEILLRHSLNSGDVGGGAATSKDQSPRRFYRRNSKATLQRIEPRLLPGGDFDDDPAPLLRGHQTDDGSRALEGSMRQKSTTSSGNRSPKRGGPGTDGGMQHQNDPRHQTHKQLSDGAILPPPRLAGQSLHRSGNTVCVPTSTVVGSLGKAEAIVDRAVPQLESRSPTEFINELARCNKEASDRCLLGPSKEEQERHRLKAGAANTEVDTQLRGGKMTDEDTSSIQTNCDGIDENPVSDVTGLEPSTPILVEYKTGQEVDGGGPAAETGQRIDIAENGPEEQDSATENKTTSGKVFNPLENYGFEWQRWAKGRRRTTAGIESVGK